MTHAPVDWVEFISVSPAATEEFGRRLAQVLPPGSVVSLHGTLGAGKTVFARGVARGLGITEPVTSPTFAIVQEYRRPHGGWFYHLDLYRIGDDRDACAFGIEEYLFRPEAVTVIEWPERIAGLLAEEQESAGARANPAAGPALVPVEIECLDDDRRRLRLPATLAGQLRY